MLGSEPVLILGAINAAIALAVGFGLHVTPSQMSLINLFVTAVLSAILRTQVSPVPPPVGK